MFPKASFFAEICSSSREDRSLRSIGDAPTVACVLQQALKVRTRRVVRIRKIIRISKVIRIRKLIRTRKR